MNFTDQILSTIYSAKMMWHEARKQERKIRGLMVDYKKRAERRREYYEKIKQDPTQFLRVYGRPYKIHLDPAVALSAESPQSMMPWQGQTDNMIDRFDVRAHLDYIPEYKSAPPLPMTKEEEEEERKCSYERYRTLVENECAALNEEQCLHQIYLDEQFGPIKRTPDEEKKKLAEKKAAIGFTYEDNNTACPAIKEEEEDDSSDTDVETADLDVTLDVDALTPDQLKMLNQCAQQYGMRDDDYVRYLRKDKEELEALRQAKLLEEEKAQFAGRKSRRERRAYKEKKLQGRKISPPSYAARASPKYEPYKRSSSSSKSRSRSPENTGKVMYITSFGGESEEDAGVLQGPSLPPDTHHQSSRGDSKGGGGGSSRSWKSTSRSSRKPSSSSRYRHRSRSPVHNTGKHRWVGRRNSRSRSASRSRSRSDPRSHSNSYRIDRRRRSCSRSRSRSRSREWKRSHSTYYGSDGRGSRNIHSRYQPRRRYSRSRSRSHSFNSSRSRSSSRSYSSSSSHSRSRSRSRSKSRSPSPHNKTRCHSKSKSPAETTAVATPPKPIVKRYRRSSLSSSAEDSKSDSDSGKSPAPPSTDTTTTTSSTVTSSKIKDSRVPAPNVLGKATLESQTSSSTLTPQERLRRRMQAALNRQYKADKKAELQKLERVEQERQDREDELRSRVMEMRRRERERRHRELEEMERDRYSQKYSNSSDSDNWSHSRSPQYHSRRSRSWSPRWSRSRSRSHSRDRGLVDY